MNDLHEMAANSREAAWTLAASSLETRNAALLRMAEVLENHQADIFAANAADIHQAEADGLAAPLLGRLKFREEKLRAVTDGLRALADLPDPIGATTMTHEITPGLKMYRVTCPIGVIGVIFESRPDALVQIASLALKSGNAVLLKGGREAERTNAALCGALREAAADVGLPADFAQLLHSREDVAAMLKEDALIDLIIPRGSKEFVRYIMDNSRIPVLGHSDGICHVYVDKSADVEMAVSIAVDSKAQNVAVCNACETLLVHRDIAADFLPKLLPAMQEKHVRLLGDEATRAIIPVEAATEEDWRTEYLDYVLSIRVVDSLEAAIAHINRYGSHHTDCIVTRDDAHVVARVNDVHRGLFPTALDFDSRHVHRNVEKSETQAHERRGDGEDGHLPGQTRDEKTEEEDDAARHAHGLHAEAPHEVRGAGEADHGGGPEREEDESEFVGRGPRLFLKRRNAGGEEPVGKARGGKEEKRGETRLRVTEGLHTTKPKRKDLHCSLSAEISPDQKGRPETEGRALRCIMSTYPKKQGKHSWTFWTHLNLPVGPSIFRANSPPKTSPTSARFSRTRPSRCAMN